MQWLALFVNFDMLKMLYQFQALHDIPKTIMYDLGSIATLVMLPESPYVHLKQAEFFFFDN